MNRGIPLALHAAARASAAASLVRAARAAGAIRALSSSVPPRSAAGGPGSGSGSPGSTDETTHFGFRTVRKDDKETLVGEVFRNVADKYDVMNDFMSGGIHRLWKDHFISSIAPSPTTQLLDVAGGTGDIAFRFLDYIKSRHGGLGSANVKVVDINPAMLQVGRERALKMGYPADSPHISFHEGNAEHLVDIPDASVDAYTIAFGIRNCTNVDQVVREAYRVLKPGGRFTCLEFSSVHNPLIRGVYDLYSFQVIPVLGQLVANDRASYEYLVESIRKFPPQIEFARMIQDAGFTVVGQGWEDLTFGVAAIHSGFKV
ncbi:hypothetical protein HK105_204178 [Polyrhizophydium stewartii]|uniref:2-methoxy-6-polyprenyl-1,4-benzoquinol methylase, mitochondrial n=1 Tax=Polyrhizophydium stewartii TaxID=2732419 RepID=A0ABR4NA87_9FUNG|nr:2-hexaprenyl-6-methoxy-1,4-benzoquinone methyltransferase [Polyrhizophydium stewartii]